MNTENTGLIRWHELGLGYKHQHEEQNCLASLEMLMGLLEDRNTEVGEPLCRGLAKDSENEHVGEAV